MSVEVSPTHSPFIIRVAGSDTQCTNGLSWRVGEKRLFILSNGGCADSDVNGLHTAITEDCYRDYWRLLGITRNY